MQSQISIFPSANQAIQLKNIEKKQELDSLKFIKFEMHKIMMGLQLIKFAASKCCIG